VGEGWGCIFFFLPLFRGGWDLRGVFDLAEVWHTDTMRRRVEIICKADSRSPWSQNRDQGHPAPGEAALGRFLLKPGVAILYADDQTTQHCANLHRQLRRQGTPIPTNHMWIAALVLQHSLVLLARDANFDVLPQIIRV